MDYYKVYLQSETDGVMVETVSAYGMYCMDIPFKMAAKAKEPASRNWNDEDGIDEYIPSTGLRLASYEMDIKFGCKGNKGSVNKNLSDFIAFLKKGYMKMYCDYTQIGRQHVRFVELSDDAELVRDINGDILVIKVKFVVSDPVTKITLKTENNSQTLG